MPTVSLPSKPGASVAYELFEGDSESDLLIVFLNGLVLPQLAWKPFPKIVEGILFLDSNPGNADYADIWPNPKDPSFDLEKMIPAGTALEVYEAAYIKMTTVFAADAKNKEGFDRRQIKSMLPDPSKPKLKGSKSTNKGPWITVAWLQGILNQQLVELIKNVESTR
ncbi:hypothetical protein M7I_3989 [Glarea lozoyensis 74030]|uniref:Uncharacterized protein n=1 Tax=Glarea lozoyensis (strain ATCC 74030 / MF5533) TaxID=1104152 RepID=H0EMZ0_GLAL7|nr:hypothetical protein M7I_3989 [Glarea lozoyensis 74030]